MLNLVVSDSLWPLSMGDSLDKNSGVGGHALLWGSSKPRDWTQVSHIEGRFFTIWAMNTGVGSLPLLQFPDPGIKLGSPADYLAAELPGKALGPSTLSQREEFRSLLWLMFHSLYVHLLYPFICWWTLTLLPYPGYCKSCCYEQWYAYIFLN